VAAVHQSPVTEQFANNLCYLLAIVFHRPTLDTSLTKACARGRR
jgi:hypothetical protein